MSALIPLWPFGNNNGTKINVSPYTNLDIANISSHPPEADIFPVSEPAHHQTTKNRPASIEEGSPIPSTRSTHDCEAQAISILRSMQHGEMYEGATSCSTNPAQYTELNLRPGFDRVLATNKTALDSCARLMKCSCALCPHIILLHVSILSKMLFWYRIAAVDKTSPLENEAGPEGNYSRTTSQFSGDPPSPSQFRVRATNIQIRMLRLDAGDECDLQNMLLLRELRRAEKVIDELINVDRTALDENGDDIVRRSVQWSLGGISRVREELQDVIQKIKQTL
ncbi:putative fusarubin cluster-transcription factor [Rosellinia necatrix]|uniref:Putative fusarubin cluster-transcription factor n=1 Tax=Rosellinia necatrix TaxID=77044 RepID=A0A1W2TTD4_ROSNE|nr:putative fusarubin cluster-transcription factor [Rosellinia necatrix]